MVTICTAVALFPTASVAVQVTVVFPKGKLLGASLEKVTPVQLSVTTGLPSTTPEAVQLLGSAMVLTLEGGVIAGFSASITVTVCSAVAVFPEASVMVHVTLVIPRGKLAGALFLTVAPEQFSLVTGVPRLAEAVHFPLSAFRVRLAGAVIVGA